MNNNNEFDKQNDSTEYYKIKISVNESEIDDLIISDRERNFLIKSYKTNGMVNAKYGSEKVSAKILCRLGLMYQFSGFSDYKTTKIGNKVRDLILEEEQK